MVLSFQKNTSETTTAIQIHVWVLAELTVNSALRASSRPLRALTVFCSNLLVGIATR